MTLVKRIISVIMIAVMLLVSVPFADVADIAFGDALFSASAYMSGGLNYTITDGEVTITGYNTNFYNVPLNIPSTLSGYPVVAIGDGAFNYCSNMSEVNIPDSVKRIGAKAFYSSGTVGQITIGSGVEEIGEDAFGGCNTTGFTVSEDNGYFSSDDSGVLYNKDKTVLIKYPAKSTLKSYVLPQTVVEVYRYAFYDATTLTDITLNNGLEIIGKSAFSYCGIKAFELPETLKEIGETAFASSDYFTEINIPASVESIGVRAFADCIKLQKVVVDEGNENYASGSEFELYSKDMTELIYFPNSYCPYYTYAEYTVAPTVVKIHEHAFYNSTVTSVTIPSNVKEIGASAFYLCHRLENVELSEGLEIIGDSAFDNTEITEIEIPASVTYIGKDGVGSDSLEFVSVDENNANYSSDDSGVLFDKNKTTLISFPKANKTAEYVFPSTVKTVAKGAFSYVKTLKSVTFSDCLEEIGESAFLFCETLATISPLKSIRIIGSSAFGYCYALKQITLYATIEEIGNSAFFCNSSQRLTDVYYSSDANAWRRINIGTSNDNLLNATIHFDSHSHEYGEWEIETGATCETSGQDVRKCAFCGLKDYRSTNALGHSYTNYVSDNNVSCKQDGTKTAKCDRCPEKDTVTIPGTKLQHQYVTIEEVPATCETYGSSEGSYCSVCFEVFAEVEDIEPLGHKFLNYVYDNNATCLENGTKTAVCAREVCDKPDTKEDLVHPALGHDRVDVERVEPDCENVGYEERAYCSRCDFVFEEGEEIPALGHIPVTDNGFGASCEASGKTEGSHCSRCDKVLTAQDDVPASGHTVVIDKAVNPTCETAGKTQGSHCSKCNKVITVQTTVSAKGHKYTTTTVKATATQDGKIETKCTVCGKVSKTTVIKKASNIALSAERFTYNNKEKKPTVSVKASDGTAITSYSVSYPSSAKAIGSYSVKITLSGNYSGTVTLNFEIVPKGTSLSSLKNGSGEFTAKWKKQKSQTNGYELQYATSKNFDSAKTVTVSKNSTLSKKVKKLKGKTKYYVRIRTYKTVNGKKYYSDWSAVKNVTTKPEIKVALKSTSLQMFIGETKTLKASVYPKKSELKWKSSNKSVVKVSSSGKLTAVKKGKATITVSFKYNDKTYKATCKVTVGKPSLSLSQTNATLEAGETLTLKATAKPSGKIKWSTSNSKVATVSKGKITAKAMGTATITASFKHNGKTYKKTCTVKVTSFLGQLAEGFSAKLIVPSVGSDKNSYCSVKFSNNTKYDATLSMHVYANGKGCANSSASGYVVKSGNGASATFYRDIIPQDRFETKDMYLDNYSTAWTILNIDGKRVYVKFDTQGNTKFGYTAAEIDEY